MTEIGLLQIVLYFVVLLALIRPLGSYMARVYQGKVGLLERYVGVIERLIYRLAGINAKVEMNWKGYLKAMLVFNFFAFLFVYALLRLQAYLPLNPQSFPAISPDIAFNTAASFITGTDWQVYSGEASMSYLSQMLGLTVVNFISAATGMALLIALMRGLKRHETSHLGNFWVDTVRGVLYILLPLSLVLALVLASQGVIQNVRPYVTVDLLQPVGEHRTQVLPMGPVASQVAIKQLGANGGGFFAASGAHPFENPTPLSNFMQMLAILLIPASLCYTFGVMVGEKRQGYALLAIMFIVFVPLVFTTIMVEQTGNPALTALGVDPAPHLQAYTGGNMEGKETRHGIVGSGLWAVAATATSNGSVNAMLDSFMPLAGMVPLWLIQLGEVIFGGVGSGLYCMLVLIIVTVFVAGLMVGRTPEYLGKKIEPFEIKMACIAMLILPVNVLISAAFAAVSLHGFSGMVNTGAHGLTEIIYAFTSIGGTNGSAFAGLNLNTFHYNIISGLLMLLSRYWIIIPVIALAGSLAHKKHLPESIGTLETHTMLFIILVVCVIIINSALSFLPALALGPIVEHLLVWGQYGN